MIEERLEKMEDMLVQFVQVGGENNRTTKDISLRMDRIEQRMDQSEEKCETKASRTHE